jgi:hypothetical protein
METRIHANPNLITIRRCTVEHPFGTIKRMSGGGRFLTRGLRAVKAEAASSNLAFNILHAANIFETRAAGRLPVNGRTHGWPAHLVSDAGTACWRSTHPSRLMGGPLTM